MIIVMLDLLYVHLLMTRPERGARPLQGSSPGVIQVVPSDWHPVLDTTSSPKTTS